MVSAGVAEGPTQPALRESVYRTRPKECDSSSTGRQRRTLVTTPETTAVYCEATSGAGCELDVDDLDGGTAEAPAVENINCDSDVEGSMPGVYTYRVESADGVGRFSVELFWNEAVAGAHSGETTAEAPASDTWTVCYQDAAGCAPGDCPEP